jgi:hypothetical protein
MTPFGDGSTFYRNLVVTMSMTLWLLLGSQYAYAQLSEYTECTEVEFSTYKSRRPLTQEEQVEAWDVEFYEGLVDIDKCSQTDSSGGGAAGGSGAGSSGQSQSTAASNGSGSGPLSKNYLKDGQNSTSVVNSASQTPEPLYETNETGSGSGTNGGKELSLSAVDNKAALRAQIKALMDVEKDPAVKDELLKQYEALK